MIEKALRIASQAHHGQTRKSTDIPYISHPVHVAWILSRAGLADERLQTAALLHDVIEDTPFTEDQLRAEFPNEVVEIVLALTEQKRDGSGQRRSWEDRKAEHLQAIAEATCEARAVFLADKLHNLATLIADLNEQGPTVWERFNAPPERLLWYYRTAIDAAQQQEESLQPLADECRQLLSQLDSAHGPSSH